MAFEIASTNLVVELGVIMALLLGWQFTAAEFIGGPLMIVIIAVLFRLFLRQRLLADAHDQADKGHHRDTIATLWHLSLERLRTRNPAAVQLLGFCAWLAPGPIPLDLFTAHPDVLPRPLAGVARDALAFTDTIAATVDYGLARRTPASLQMHRLVQDVIRAMPA